MRVALVSGGARGIGRAIALALASDGRQVAIGDLLEADARATVDEIERAGGRAAAMSLDVTDSGSVAATVQSVAVPRIGRGTGGGARVQREARAGTSRRFARGRRSRRLDAD
jgi:3-oxoacyl-[acyl-carrier protein] reductase